MSQRCRSAFIRGLVVVAAAVVIPACGGSTSTPGPEGAPGVPGVGVNPVLAWTDPVNLSNQASNTGSDAWGQQAVFTADGRLHVVFFATDDLGTGNDELWYTSAAAPYAAWDVPVLLTNDPTYTPNEFDLAAGDNDVHIVYSADSGVSETELYYLRNTSDTRLAFTRTDVYEELNGNGTIYNPQIVMRGDVAHVVWLDDDAVSDWSYYYSNNSDDGDFFAAPTVLEAVSFSGLHENQLVLVNDTAGNTHLLHASNNGQEQLRYRTIPAGAGDAGVFNAPQVVNPDDGQSIHFGQSVPPTVLFDGDSNVYVFWKAFPTGGGGPQLICNIKPAGGVFTRDNAAVVTDSPIGGSLGTELFPEIGDVSVDADGRIHAVWRDDNSFGTSNNYPVQYRTKSPGTNAQVGWSVAEIAAFTSGDPSNGNFAQAGFERSALVRSADDGSVHVFYGDESSTDLFHTWRSSSGVWRNTGSLSRATVSAFAPAGIGSSFLLDAGLDEDGLPSVLFTSWMSISFGRNGDLHYTKQVAGQWAVGADINGSTHVEADGYFWAGRDGDGKLHVLWQDEVDPFDANGVFDLMHANQ